MLKNKKFAIIFSIFAMFLWGSAIPTIKTTYLELGIGASDTGQKILVAGIRFFMAGIITLIYFLIFDKNYKDFKKLDWKFVIILGLIQTSIQYLFYYIGLSNTFGVKSSIIQAANSFIVVIFSALLLPEDKINSKMILALVIGTIGIIITNTGKPIGGQAMKLTGEGFIIVSTSINALCTVLVRKYGKGMNGYLLTGLQFFVGSIILIIVGRSLSGGWISFTSKAAILLVYAAFISATAFTIWTLVLQKHSANEFGIYKLFIPLFGSILSVIVLGEVFTLRLALGMVLVLSASLILNINKRKN
ncbi:DMT family transporter [uncultured Anaerococcus sp.]|uniref:DMT family transporter n=1 Tax=uncultured Anaerococcus sp. TaxID=293428 RepID=UPI0028057962|nr:DMT family transporter [uncultured Anaerococcus sp.]